MVDKQKFTESMEDVKGKIKAVQAGVKALQETGINDDVLYYMIQKASPSIGKGVHKAPVTIKSIKAIVQGLDRLYEVTFPDKK